jgi:hypothetical protein
MSHEPSGPGGLSHPVNGLSPCTSLRRKPQLKIGLFHRHALRLVSMVATRCPEPPPRPGPGWVEAAMCQSRPTEVAWRPDEAVQLGGAAVRIAVDGVGVAVAQVVRCQDVDRADFGAQIGGVQ